MEKINAFKCDFCSKILQTRSGMHKHENKCFQNPSTESCITCNFLCTELFINGRILTTHEQNILEYKIDGTYHLVTEYEEAHHYELNDEYKYLYNSEPESYCSHRLMILNKLKTNCAYHG